MSNFLHENVFEGDELSVSLPFGDLVLEEGPAPLFLVDRLPGTAMHHWYEDLGVRSAGGSTKLGILDLEGVEVPADAQVYLCGPLPFMESVRRSLLLRDIPDRNIKYEVFGPDTWLASA